MPISPHVDLSSRARCQPPVTLFLNCIGLRPSWLVSSGGWQMKVGSSLSGLPAKVDVFLGSLSPS
jgi:hypothetical protein